MKAGDKIIKINSEEGDFHNDGATGKVADTKEVCKLKDLPLEVIQKQINLVFVYWDDMPEEPCAIQKWRLKLDK